MTRITGTTGAGPRAGFRAIPSILLTLVALAAGSVVPAGPVAAQVLERMQPDFTFRRVTVPGAGVTNRITAQIDPSAPSAIRAPGGPRSPATAGTPLATTPASAVVPAAPAPSGYEWYWDIVSPSLDARSSGRLGEAVAALAAAPAGTPVPQPRVQTLQDIASAHGAAILLNTVGTRVSPALVLAVIQTESGGRADAESRSGAVGLMQLMPATAERFGVTDRLDPAQNIAGGVAYLDWLLGHFDGDPVLAIAAYNSGEGAVRDNGGVPPYAETRGYVPKVLSAWTVARGLCSTPPDLIGDGCVFAVNAVSN